MTKMECENAKYENEFVNIIFHSDAVKLKIDNGTMTFSKNDIVVMIFKKSE
jgi:hypothetical protein